MRDQWSDEGVGCLAVLTFLAGMFLVYWLEGLL